MNEERRPVIGYEGVYAVSKDGDIYRVIGNGHGTKAYRKLKPSLDTHGYYTVALCRNGVAKTTSIHRIVAKSWIDNPGNLPQINHLNGIRTDNNADNLEWCTCGQNHTHAYRVLGRINPCSMLGKPKPAGSGVPKRPVQGTHLRTGVVREFESIREAARQVGDGHSNISKVCQGKYKSAYGYIWKYV